MGRLRRLFSSGQPTSAHTARIRLFNNRRVFARSPSLPPAERRDDGTQRSLRVTFRATWAFLSNVRKDLMRPHAFAHERVGFITVRAAQGIEGLVLLAENYYP